MREPAVRPAAAQGHRRRHHSSVSEIGPGVDVGSYVVERGWGQEASAPCSWRGAAGSCTR